MKCILMGVYYCTCEGLWSGVLCFVKYIMIVDKDVRAVFGWRHGVVVDGCDCGMVLCVEGSIGVQLSMGTWYGL